MKTFKQMVLNEFPYNNRIDQKIDRSEEYSSSRTKKIIGKNKIYTLWEDANTYYITMRDKYVAHINTSEKQVYFEDKKYKALLINEGNADIKGTYYHLLISILMFTKYDFIFSDKSISPKAIEFYKKILNVGGGHEPFLLEGNTVKSIERKPSKKVLNDIFSDSYIRVGLSISVEAIYEGRKKRDWVSMYEERLQTYYESMEYDKVKGISEENINLERYAILYYGWS